MANRGGTNGCSCSGLLRTRAGRWSRPLREILATGQQPAFSLRVSASGHALAMICKWVAALACLLLCGPAVSARSATWPGDDWARSSPEAQGVASADVARLIEDIVRPGRRIDAVLLISKGHLIAELVVAPYDAAEPHDLRSITKSVVSTLVGVALQRRDLRSTRQRLDEFVALPPAADPRQRAITIEHLLDMRSGIAWREWPYDQDSDLLKMAASPDWLAYILARPMRDEPGARFWYSGAAPHLVSAALQRATGQALATYAREHLFKPLGITQSPWMSDAQGLSIGDSALSLRPHDLARLGWLLMTDGVWRGQRLLPAGWLTELLNGPQSHGLRDEGALLPRFKRMWWVDPAVPIVQAVGRHGQYLVLLPRQETLLVVVAKSSGGADAAIDMRRVVTQHLLRVTQASSALPPNPAGERVLRQVIDSRSVTTPLSSTRPPPTALALSGRRIRFEPNGQGVSAVELRFDDQGRGQFLMAWGNRKGDVLARPFGADGQYSLSARTPWGVFATRATWPNERTVEIESERLQGSTVTKYQLTFDDDRVVLSIEDQDSPKSVLNGRP